MKDYSRAWKSAAASVGAIVLAAGSSTRMGAPKQALRFRGQSLLRRAVLNALAAGCRPVIVVTGAHAEQSRAELEGLDARAAENPQWASGMGSSIRAGIAALLAADADSTAAILLLCDQPFVTSNFLQKLISERRATGRAIVASQYGGSFGPPALFDRELFAELARLEDATGAKQLIAARFAEAHFVPFPQGEIDVDTPEDFARLLSERKE